MKFLFNMTNPSILHTAATAQELLFDEDNFPPHLAHIRSFRVEGIDDPLFLGVRKHWPELKLRQLYTWLKLQPPLGPTKWNEDTFLEIRMFIRSTIATQLKIEPNKLPALESYTAVISSVPAPPPAPRLPTAQRGSVGPLIHRVATEMWEAAGSPTDVGVILQLRRRIMTALLDDHKIKIATSSNELGRWQKQLVTIKG